MRISDWSSDVCSSDLPVAGDLRCLDLQPAPGRLRRGVDPGHAETDGLRPRAFQRHLPDRDHRLHGFLHLPRAGDAAPVALIDRVAVKPWFIAVCLDSARPRLIGLYVGFTYECQTGF